MRAFITIIVLFMYVTNSFAQELVSTDFLERIEKLLSRKDIENADSLIKCSHIVFGDDNSSFKEDYIAGLLFYYKEQYGEAISVLSSSLTKMDHQQLWDCENYLKTAFYLADSYIHLDKIKDSETVINYALVKSVNSYNTCLYAKKIFQLLLTIYERLGYSSSVIEQVHNEIQKIAINIYASNISNKDGEDVREKFLFFTSPAFAQEDTLSLFQGKAAYLYIIGEYEEAIRLYEKVKSGLPIFDPQLKGINESLLVMYSSTAQMEHIEELLPEMLEFSRKYELDYDQFSLNNWVGHNLFQNGHYSLARIYFERCDSFLETHKTTQDWVEKKKNMLSKMVLNCRLLGEYNEVIRYCKEYSKFIDSKYYEEYFFVNYHQGLALRALEKYEDAIKALEALMTYVQKNQGSINENIIMVNLLLGICYDRTNRSNDFFKCASTSIDVYKKMQLNDNSLLGTLYNNLGKAYLQRGEYNKALSFLNLSAGIQIEQTGIVSQNTKRYIDECKRKQK